MLRENFFLSSLLFFFFLKIPSDSSIFWILQFLGNFMHSYLDEGGPSSPIFYTNVFSRWDWSAHLLAFNYCRLCGSSSCCDSINAHSEFLRSDFWIFMSYSFRYDFLWIACWALRWRCSRRSHPSEKNFLITLQKRIFCYSSDTLIITVPLTFLWHRLCTTDHKTFSFFSFSIQQRFPDCMLSLLSLGGTKSPMRNVRNRRFKHCGNTDLASVLVSGFFEKSEILWFGSLVSIVSLSTEVFLSNSCHNLC